MPNNNLYDQLLSPKMLKIGWHLYRRDQKQNFIENFYPTAVASADLDATIEEIRKRLINNDYKPRNLLRTEIPKKGLGVRPGATMWVEDAIVLNTIMYLLAFPLNDLLSPNVYSFRLREDIKKKKKYENGKDFFTDTTVAELPFLKRSTIYKKFLQYDEWYTTWVEFDKKAVDNIINYNYMATSDISAYFENIQLPILKNQILQVLTNESKLINLLFDILMNWTERTSNGEILYRGLPQGSSVFSFFGNFYLKPIDDYFLNHQDSDKFEYFRYMDDIKIFTNDMNIAKKLLLELNRELRKLHLNTQSAKTQIFNETNNNEISHELIDLRIEKLKKIETKDIDTSSQKDKKELLTKIKKIISEKSYSGTTIKGHKKPLSGLDMRLFQLYITSCCALRNSKFINSYFRELTLNFDQKLLKKLPTIAKVFSNNTSLEKKIVEFMNSEGIIIPYQKAICIKSLRYLNKISPSTQMLIYDILLNAQNDYYARFESAMLLSTMPLSTEQIKQLQTLWTNETNIFLQSALSFILIQSSDKGLLMKKLLFYPNNELNKVYILFYNLRNNPKFVKEKLDFYINNPVDHISLINMAASSDRLEILQILKNKLMNKNIAQIKNTRIKSYLKDIKKEVLLKINSIKNKK